MNYAGFTYQVIDDGEALLLKNNKVVDYFSFNYKENMYIVFTNAVFNYINQKNYLMEM